MFYTPGRRDWQGLKEGAVRSLETVLEYKDKVLGLVGQDPSTNPVWLSILYEHLYRSGYRPSSVDVELLEWQVRWAFLGLPSFSLTGSLAAQFLLTEIESIPVEGLGFPMSAFLIHVPAELGLTVTGPEGHTPVKWLVVNRTEGTKIRDADVPVVDQALRSTLGLGENGTRVPSAVGAQLRMEKATEILREATGGSYVPRLMVRAVGDNGLGVYFGSTSVEALRCKAGAWLRFDKVATEMRLTPDDERTLRRAWRLVVNTLLYLEAHPENVVPRPPALPPKKGEKLRAGPVQLGRDVKVSPELRGAARAYARGLHDTSTWKAVVKHVVRGHHKLQPHGQGRSLKRRLWIAPYWRGPEHGPRLVERRYHLA